MIILKERIKKEAGAKWVLASTLSPTLQQGLLRRFLYRYTGDNKPNWVRDAESKGQRYPLHFKDDKDWLAHTEVAINSKGELDKRNTSCRSSPTWPNGDKILSVD